MLNDHKSCENLKELQKKADVYIYDCNYERYQWRLKNDPG
ncbi:IS3 family transposase [Neobacillus niacini]